MKTKTTYAKGLLLILTFLISNYLLAGTCHPYIDQLNNGDLKFSVTFSQPQAYVEVFVKKNGTQTVAQNIVSSGVANSNGSYTYSNISPAGNYASGDKVSTRFYSYMTNSPGVFTPGPDQSVWSPEFFYSQTCNTNATACHPYIQEEGTGDLKLSVTFAQPQAYVEVFVKKNGVQTIAQNIVNTAVLNSNGTYTYYYYYPASNFVTGDIIATRFYSYMTNSPGVFTPGPDQSVWSSDFVYNQTCKSPVIYVSTTGNDANPGTLALPVKTVTKGVALAQANGALEVRVAQGTYQEGNINVFNGLHLYGGYSSDFSTRDLTFTNYISTIDANQPTGYMVCGNARILRIADINTETIVEGFRMIRGRLCDFGGGIYIANSSAKLIIRNNKLDGNSSVGSTNSYGGNIYMTISAAQIYNNYIINGFAGTSGSDIYVTGKYQGTTLAQVFNNTFTSETMVMGLENTIHYGNRYLNQLYVCVSVSGNDANSGTSESPVATVTKGVALASTIHAKEVHVSAGTYVEGNINVVNGISLYGGYSTDFIYRSPNPYETKIDAQQPTGFMVCGSKRIFKAINITDWTFIDGFTITGGRLCDYGGGIYIYNSSERLVISNNKITGNSSVGNGTSDGGNIYIGVSAAQIKNNVITNGFAGAGFGNDIGIQGIYSSGLKTEISYNTLTSASSSIYGTSDGNIHDNTYLNAKTSSISSTNQFSALEIQQIDDKIIIQNSTLEDVTTNVVDIMGQPVIKNAHEEISVEGWKSGIYIIKAEAGSATITDKIYIK